MKKEKPYKRESFFYSLLEMKEKMLNAYSIEHDDWEEFFKAIQMCVLKSKHFPNAQLKIPFFLLENNQASTMQIYHE